MKKSTVSRRSFLGKAAAVGAAGLVVPSLITSCSRENKSKKAVTAVAFLDKAPDGPVLKAGLIGCGGRGKGAAVQFINAGPNLQITALGDTFKDRLEDARAAIKKEGQEIADEKCFVGFDAFQKVIESGVDVVILATPPFFRPMHFEAAVAARKHVFMEKPVCVDPVGARSVMATALKAKELELCVVTGTQRRHQRDYNAAWTKIQEGMIGDIIGAECYWNQNQLWYRDHVKEWSEMEYMIRDWVNWSWLSGDHIVEQHVHNIDVINWFTGSHPVKAVSFGSRQRRKTGDQFDNFSTDFVYENGMHLHSMCRQINGCANDVSEIVHGSDGWVYTADRNHCEIYDKAGIVKWQYSEYVPDKDGKPTHNVKINPYNQEHIDLVTAIRTGKTINEAEGTAVSTLTAIMGRISAYSGKMVTWDEMLNSDLKLGPKVFDFGPVDVPKVIAVPGEGDKPAK
jgi:myo-inositol 2-dehydrogenase / D-chiro-inositol 1-dehydrogenase